MLFMKYFHFVLFFFCISTVMAQKKYDLQLRFITDKKTIAPNVKVTFLKNINTESGAVVIDEVVSDSKGILNLKLSDKYFDKNGWLGIQAFYDEKDVYYLSYYEEISKKQIPFKKTIVFEHVIPLTLEEIDENNVPPPPRLP